MSYHHVVLHKDTVELLKRVKVSHIKFKKLRHQPSNDEILNIALETYEEVLNKWWLRE